MANKITCTCGHSWDKSDSSKKDAMVCHICGKNNMKNGGWLENYSEGGRMQEHQENYNDSDVSMPEGFVGMGNNTQGRNYSPAWGGQFEEGGMIPQAQKGLTFLEPTSSKLPIGYANIPSNVPSSELAQSIGGEDGEPAFLIPTFKYGHPLEDASAEFRKTGEHLGGPFKTWQEADEWERNVRHPYVEKGQDIPTPLRRWGKDFAMGGSLPGSVGFMYARTNSPAPSNGPYAKKTKASAQNGQEMKYYQEGLDWKPKMISKNGSVIEDDMGQWAHPGEITKINSNQITMKGVDYPVLGISDAGDRQMMYPDQEYTFKGRTVTEYPQKKKNGGWLDKYN